MDKQSILNHIDDLTAEQLANFIIQGVVTLKELKDTLNLDRSKAVAISAIVKKIDDDKRKVEEEKNTVLNKKFMLENIQETLLSYQKTTKQEAQSLLGELVALRALLREDMAQA
jgi:hypothetical protein